MKGELKRFLGDVQTLGIKLLGNTTVSLILLPKEKHDILLF